MVGLRRFCFFFYDWIFLQLLLLIAQNVAIDDHLFKNDVDKILYYTT